MQNVDNQISFVISDISKEIFYKILYNFRKSFRKFFDTWYFLINIYKRLKTSPIIFNTCINNIAKCLLLKDILFSLLPICV